MAEDQDPVGAEEEVDYSPHEEDTFDVWVALGAADPEQRRILEHSPLGRYEKKVKSSSPEAEALIHQPLRVLLNDRIPGVTPDSVITTTIHHHERGLNKKIIRAAITVDDTSGDVGLEFTKETW